VTGGECVRRSSPNLIPVIESERQRLAGHVARYGGEVYAGLWCEKFRAKRPLGSPGSRQKNNRGVD